MQRTTPIVISSYGIYLLTIAPAVISSSASYIHIMVKLPKMAMTIPPPMIAGTPQKTNIPNFLLISIS
jgi:hypothetical protein